MTTAVLEVEGLQYRRDAGYALDVPALALQPGESVGIVGPSGCGKSTLIDLLALLRRPSALRRLALCGHDAAALWQRGAVEACTELRARHVGVVLQTGGLLPSLSARENVLLSQRLLGRVDAAWADTLLATLELTPHARRRPAQLSSGQRQRVAVARALAHRPALVLADEPTASLGVDHAPAVLALLTSLARDSGSALLVVSHDIALLRAHGIALRALRQRAGGAIELDPVAAA